MATFRKILIADDHPGARALIRDLLAQLDCEIIECANGAEAVAAYEKHRPDCVLLDLEMPVMDGAEAARTIIAKHPAARLVIVTQHDDRQIRELSLSSGASMFLSKAELYYLPDLLSDL